MTSRREKHRNRQCENLMAFAASVDVPSTPVRGENREERGLRIIESILKRQDLADASGVFGTRERMTHEHIRQGLIVRRMHARIAVKMSRGDY